jgi:hypothetical protein
MRPLTREDVLPFVERDWSLHAELKAEAWLARRRELGPAGAFRLADELRRQALLVRPDGPDAEARRADLDAHIELARRLRRAGGTGRG